MFGISFSEIILIFVIGLIIFGPKKIPLIARSIAKFIYSVKSYVNNTKQNIYQQSGLHEIKDTTEELRNIYNNLRYNLNINQINSNTINNTYQPYDNLNEEPIYFQPELDFERQGELFDNDNLNYNNK